MESARIQPSQGRQIKKSFVPPFKASSQSCAMPPSSPPILNEIFSQVSQRELSSTQLFRSNSEYFDRTRNNILDGNVASFTPFDNKNAFSKSICFGQNRQNSGLLSDPSLPLAPSQSLQFIENDDNDECQYYDEEVIQDSPELFSQRMEIEHGAKFDGKGSCNQYRRGLQRLSYEERTRLQRLNKGLNLIDYDHEDEEIYTTHPLQVPQHHFSTPSQLVIRGSAFEHESGNASSTIGLRSVNEIPLPYRVVFSKFPYFNIVQSKVFDEVMYTDRPMVVCAPTGSGKTVIFELAIIRQLMNSEGEPSRAKVVYMAPMKALCSERFQDWKAKFERFGLKCKEVTGDSELDDYYELQSTGVIMTTPEKWDSMTRKWRDNRSLVQSVRLFLIDEVHLLNDDARGATVEAVISRMKTVQSTTIRHGTDRNTRAGMRLLAISATIPNVDDIAAWLGGIDSPALHYSMDDSYRPVKLRKVVLGFNKSSNFSDFGFDLSLNYKLSGIIQTYSDRKPTLVFCSTRKSAQQAAQMLVKDARFIINSQHRQRLQRTANSLHDSKLRELVICGIGYHHAGLDAADRRNIEAMFVKGDITVLFATSTLAVGVNLPAHLVIIKSTAHYVMGVFQEYSETQILQMIGRAGRPQFDTSATAVILTTNANKEKYTGLLEGTQNLESSLHHHLIEHLNAEIVLNTITDVSIALEWLKSTFLYIRILKNPMHYGIPEGLEKGSLEQKLQDLCLKSLNTLDKSGLIKMDDGFDLKPTEPGRLMARYCIAYDSMKQFLQIKGKESLSDMVELVSKCKEFSDVKLRVSEKRALNVLNKDKNKQTIRFPINGKIKTTDQKVNCLIQATLGSLIIAEFSLNQDITKIFRSGQRITRCLTELQMLQTDFIALQNSIILSKCMKARLWENSKFLSRQLEKIGPSLSNMMVNAGLTTFKKIEETNPREIEMIVNRHPPFGNQIREAASNLPKFEVSAHQTGRHQLDRAEVIVTLTMTNYIRRREVIGSEKINHFCVLVIGDADNKVVFKQRLGDTCFMKEGYWSKKVDVQRAKVQSSELSINLISQDYVGLDVSTTFTPQYNGNQFYPTIKREPGVSTPQSKRKVSANTSTETKTTTSLKADATRVPCNHRCLNKEICGHDCCKQGVISKAKKKKPEDNETTTLTSQHKRIKDPPSLKNGEVTDQNHMDFFLKNLHQRTRAIPDTPAAKRLKKMSGPETGQQKDFVDLTLSERFGYNRKTANVYQGDSKCYNSATTKTGTGRSWEEIDGQTGRLEEKQSLVVDLTDDNDLFEDEMPCFSIDELWNENDISLVSSDENDLLASPEEQSLLKSCYFKTAVTKKRQRDPLEVKQVPSNSTQFVEETQTRKGKTSFSSVRSSQAKDNLNRVSPSLCSSPYTVDLNPLEIPVFTSSLSSTQQMKNFERIGSSPLPPSRRLDDFETEARRAHSEQWKSSMNDVPTPVIDQQSHESHNWDSLTEEFLDEFATEDWSILPVHGLPRTVLRHSSTDYQRAARAGLNSSDEHCDKKTSLRNNSMSAAQDDFSPEGATYSPIPSSFFSAKSLKSEQDNEEQDAFAGIFDTLF